MTFFMHGTKDIFLLHEEKTMGNAKTYIFTSTVAVVGKEYIPILLLKLLTVQ